MKDEETKEQVSLREQEIVKNKIFFQLMIKKSFYPNLFWKPLQH